MRDIKKEIDTLEKKLLKLKEEDKKENALPENQRLATYLHAKLCRWNHVDGCGWDYGSWKYPRTEQLEYLAKADEMLGKHDYETCISVLRMI